MARVPIEKMPTGPIADKLTQIHEELCEVRVEIDKLTDEQEKELLAGSFNSVLRSMLWLSENKDKIKDKKKAIDHCKDFKVIRSNGGVGCGPSSQKLKDKSCTC